MSIVHRFRYNELFMFAGNDVTAISSLGGASGKFWLQILKGRPRFYIHVQLTLFVYLERFRRHPTFFIWLGFPYWERYFGEFWAKWPPKRQNREKHLTGGHFFYAKLRLLSHCSWNYLYPFGLCRCARKKGSKEEKSQEVYISRMRGATPSGRIPTKLNKCVCLTDVIKPANFHRYKSRGFGAVRC